MSEFALSYVKWLRAFFLHSKNTKKQQKPGTVPEGIFKELCG